MLKDDINLKTNNVIKISYQAIKVFCLNYVKRQKKTNSEQN